jgi:predicted ribosomally synthesized peptide with nif11-like leader
MSYATVKGFFAKVEGDKELRAKMKALAARENSSRDEAIAEVVKMADAAGFKFSVQDFVEASRQEATASDVPAINKDDFPCEATVAWRGNPPQEGCSVLAGCGYQHTNWKWQSCGSHTGQAW